MTYRKKLATPRHCTYCGDAYAAVDRRRLYCCPSCKTRASQARRRARPGNASAALAGVTESPTSVVAPAPAASLAFDIKTVGVIAAGTMLGTYGTRAVDALTSKPAPAPPAKSACIGLPVREDPANWFPAPILAAPTASTPVYYPGWPHPYECLVLDYFGRRFYYQPTQRMLLWECAPGQLWLLNLPAEFTRVFELPIPALAPAALAAIAAPVQLKTLG
jgi:predicted  nucleic acid-binding Zn-ribbon protein